MGRRRNSSSVTNFLSDIADDIKDFIDDELIDRGRDTERDLRKAGRNWVDSDDDGDRGSRRDDVAELREAIKALSAKVDSLATKK
ncbi:MAG TPA: hypothetical protein VGH89_01815 [Pseudonocardia sp.]|jgi:hypothetical protein